MLILFFVDIVLSIFFFTELFFIFLESSETHADPGLNEIGAKLNFSSKFFKMTILLNEKIQRNRKIVLKLFSEISHLLGQKNQSATFEWGRVGLGRGVGLHVGKQDRTLLRFSNKKFR